MIHFQHLCVAASLALPLRLHFLSLLVHSLNVTLSHDATCVPSTCSDDDGHPERSSSIVPGEPTGQRGQYMLTAATAHIYTCAWAVLTRLLCARRKTCCVYLNMRQSKIHSLKPSTFISANIHSEPKLL